MNPKFFYLLLILGLLIRLMLLTTPGFVYDIDAWFAWAIRLYDLGFPSFYSEAVWTHYTPGYFYILWFQGLIRNILQLDPSSFYLFLKIPPILADLFLSWLIYKIVREKIGLKTALVAGSLILFNPVVIFNSAVWGQIDGVLSLLSVLTVYYLTKNQLIFSSIIYGLAILIKPQAVALVPVFGLFLLNQFNLKKTFQLILPATLVVIFFSAPFFIQDPIFGVFKLIIQMSKDYTATSLNAYNLWGVIGMWMDDQERFLILSYQNWGYLVLVIYWLTITFFYWKKKLNLYSLSALACLSFFFLPTRVHERYLYPAIPFLILAAFQFKSKILIWLTVILSLIHFMNLYYVYVLYNHNLNWQLGYNFLEQNAKLLSVVSVFLFLILTYLLIKLNYRHAK